MAGGCLTAINSSSIVPTFKRSITSHGCSRIATRITAQRTSNQQQELNLSVLRFTLGIPGLDESYLPRWIGVASGTLIVLNHFLSPGSPAPAQLRSEALGIVLAAFSITLPYLGKFLKGTNPVDRSSLPEGNKQMFVMSENLSATQKEDLAWGSYVLLRNTNTMSVLILVEDALCVRGYWNVAEHLSKPEALDLFRKQVQQIELLDLKGTLYFPQSTETDSQLQGMLPKGTISLLIQPIFGDSVLVDEIAMKSGGFILLASSASYAYSDRDIAWIKAVANKFLGRKVILGAKSVQLFEVVMGYPANGEQTLNVYPLD